MITVNIAQEILFSPIDDGADELLILSGYAAPHMASWYIKSLQERKMRPISIKLLIGMTSYDGISLQAHEGFKTLHSTSYPNFSKFSCSYVHEAPPIHSNLYIWLHKGTPFRAFTGSVEFMPISFLSGRHELAVECDPNEAYSYFVKAEARSIYCSHNEIENFVILRNSHYIDEGGKLQSILSGEGITQISLSLLSKNGEIGEKSGLNWGNRNKRNRNEAYIPLPSKMAKSGFFPLNGRHFTTKTDDGNTLILRVEQQNNKAITTPLHNSDLGEYFRRRLNLANGDFISKEHLLSYGRTDVTFYKIDDEEFYMDFSVHDNLGALIDG